MDRSVFLFKYLTSALFKTARIPKVELAYSEKNYSVCSINY